MSLTGCSALPSGKFWFDQLRGLGNPVRSLNSLIASSQESVLPSLMKQYWKYPFIKDGKTLSWEEAIKEFKDRTGLPSPRNWSNQNFPEGKAEHPVRDITWYEAAAYATFRGKQLPTIFQWEKSARNGNVSALGNYMPWGIFYPGDTLDYRANFNNDGTRPVSS